MSLIPSESHSFPDEFSRMISRARVLNEIKAAKSKSKPPPRNISPITNPAKGRDVEKPMDSAPVLPKIKTTKASSLNRNIRPRKLFGPARVAAPVHVDLAQVPPKKVEAVPVQTVIRSIIDDDVSPPPEVIAAPQFKGSAGSSPSNSAGWPS
jgi:hypothetical protein